MTEYKLTDEHRAQLRPWADKWIANALSTKAMDDKEREICREAVKGLYRAANLTPPPDNRIVFVSSPFVLRFAGGFASAIWNRRSTHEAIFDATYDATDAATDNAIYDATDNETYAATRAATYSATRAATDAATRAATDAATFDATDNATRAVTFDATRAATRAATFDATRAATYDVTFNATYSATRAATDAATYDATDAATRAATDAATYDATKSVNSKKWYVFDIHAVIDLSKNLGLGDFGIKCANRCYWDMYQGGNQWSGSAAFLSFFRHVAKLNIDYSKYDYWEKLSEHSGPRIMHKKFCIISDRPEVLTVDEQNRPHNDTGPFCRWRDGSALYSVHGVRVPAYVVERPETITVQNIEDEENVEVRRVMIQRYGAARYMKDAGAVMIDQKNDINTGTPVKLWRKNRPNDTPIVMVEMINKTPEPDGSTKTYFIRVKPDIADAREAVAWHHNQTLADYLNTQKGT